MLGTATGIGIGVSGGGIGGGGMLGGSMVVGTGGGSMVGGGGMVGTGSMSVLPNMGVPKSQMPLGTGAGISTTPIPLHTTGLQTLPQYALNPSNRGMMSTQYPFANPAMSQLSSGVRPGTAPTAVNPPGMNISRTVMPVMPNNQRFNPARAQGIPGQPPNPPVGNNIGMGAPQYPSMPGLGGLRPTLPGQPTPASVPVPPGAQPPFGRPHPANPKNNNKR